MEMPRSPGHMLAMTTAAYPFAAAEWAASALSGKFNKGSEFDSAFMIAGHFEIGMACKIKVIGKDMIAPKT